MRHLSEFNCLAPRKNSFALVSICFSCLSHDVVGILIMPLIMPRMRTGYARAHNGTNPACMHDARGRRPNITEQLPALLLVAGHSWRIPIGWRGRWRGIEPSCPGIRTVTSHRQQFRRALDSCCWFGRVDRARFAEKEERKSHKSVLFCRLFEASAASGCCWRVASISFLHS